MFRIIKPNKLNLPQSADIYTITAAYIYRQYFGELPKDVKQKLLIKGKREYYNLKQSLQNTILNEGLLADAIEFGPIKKSNKRLTIDVLSRHSILYDGSGIIALCEDGTGIFMTKQPRNIILTDDPAITDYKQVEHSVIKEFVVIVDIPEARHIVYTLINPLDKSECEVTVTDKSMGCNVHKNECPYKELADSLLMGDIIEPRSNKMINKGGEYVIPIKYLNLKGDADNVIDPIAEPKGIKLDIKIESYNKLSIPRNSKFFGKHESLAPKKLIITEESIAAELNILNDTSNPYLRYISATTLQYLSQGHETSFYHSLLDDFGGRNKLNNKLKQLVEYSSIYMLAPITAIYDIMLPDSRIKSSSELDNINNETSNDPLVVYENRSKMEHEYFGIDLDDVHSFPKYGFIGTTNRPLSLINIAKKDFAFAEFGTILLEFKPEVKARSTFNVGDTGLSPTKAAENIMLCPLSDINVDAFSLLMLERLPRIKELMPGFNTGVLNFVNFLVNLTKIKPNLGLDFETLTANNNTNNSNRQLNIRAHYIEAQIYGKLTREDIKSVYSEDDKSLLLVNTVLKNNKQRDNITLHNYTDEMFLNPENKRK